MATKLTTLDADSDPRPADLKNELGRRGFPLFLHPRQRSAEVLQQSTSGLWVLLILSNVVLDFSAQVSGLAPADDAALPTRAATESLVLLLTPLWAGLLVVTLRRVPATRRQVLTVLGAVALLTAAWWGPAGFSLAERFVAIILVLLASYLGVGRMTGWAARRSRKEIGSLGPMIGRVLPLLIFTMLFFFFNAEVWQVVYHISMPRTWALFAVIVGAGIVLAWVATRDLVSDLVESEDDGAQLRVGERANLVLNLMLITLVQVVLLSCVVFLFFLAFGALSVPDSTAEAWMGAKPAQLHGAWSILHLNQNLVQVCLIMAAIAGLSFVSSATSDPAYRATFVDPALAEMREALAVRRRYREATSASASSGAHTGP